ncbi:MAG: Patatin [Clostridia bacterium]|nr:Patatin [Clostridia bacterium]
MKNTFKNMVFEGGGVWGIAYLGMLDYLYHNDLLESITRVAGTSAGAITACIISFNLSFKDTVAIVNSLEYNKFLGRGELLGPKIIPAAIKVSLNKLFGDIDCVYRLITQYGWYSSEYCYTWIKEQIASQFDWSKKLPPYTFADFKDDSLHKHNHPFRDLYVVGTDISNRISRVFCYENTPDMEVAEAVRISMSIPLFFESVKTSFRTERESDVTNFFSDGAVMYNYPINLFDKEDPPEKTLGGMFKSDRSPQPINNLVDFITNVLACTLDAQLEVYLNNPEDMARSIQIETKDVSSTDFNIVTGDSTYDFLYRQGYLAAQNFFAAPAKPRHANHFFKYK